MKQYKSCDDETLTIDLYLNGNVWAKDYVLPIDYYTEANGLSSVDLIEMVYRTIPLSNEATIAIIVLNKGFESQHVWDWSKLIKTTYLLNCAELRSLKEYKYVGINIVPNIPSAQKQTVRTRSSANNFLPRLVKEPTGRYPQKWWTLLVTNPKTGKRMRNPRLPSNITEPYLTLPQLGWGFYLHERRHNKNATPEQYYAKFNDQIRSILRVPPDSLSASERLKVDSLLQDIDADYTYFKQEIDHNEDYTDFFQAGYAILPDLERGKYMWVYTDVKKKGVDELKSNVYQCALCQGEPHFGNRHLGRMFCSDQCHTAYREIQ